MIFAVGLVVHQLINHIGDKRRRDDSCAPVAKQNVSASGLATIRKTFRGLYAQRKSILALPAGDPKRQSMRSREANAQKWRVSSSDRGLVWQYDDLTGEIKQDSPCSGKNMAQMVDDEESTWLIRYDSASRFWFIFPKGTFAMPRAIADRGHDPGSRLWRQNANEFIKNRPEGPLLTNDEWEHLINLHQLVEDLPLAPAQYSGVSHVLKSVIPELVASSARTMLPSDFPEMQERIEARPAPVPLPVEDPAASHTSATPIGDKGKGREQPVQPMSQLPVRRLQRPIDQYSQAF